MKKQAQGTSTGYLSEVRYRVNLSLFVVVVLLFTLWFYRHLHLYVTETVLIGGTLTLWAVWKIFCSVINWSFGGEKDTLARHLIGKPWATEYLVLSLILLALLYGTTASIYLVYQGAESGESRFKVDVLNNQNPYIERMELTSYNRVAGRPFILHLSRVNLEYRIVEPVGFRSIQRNLYPWTSTYLRVPQDFERKRLHLLRLIAAPTLYVKLPSADDEPKQRYFLDVEYQGKHYIIEDLRRQIVYTGASKLEMIELSKREETDLIRRELEDYLAHLRLPPENSKRIIATLLGATTYLAAGEFQSGDEITITLGKVKSEDSDSEQTQIILRKGYRVRDKASQTIWLEPNHD